MKNHFQRQRTTLRETNPSAGTPPTAALAPRPTPELVHGLLFSRRHVTAQRSRIRYVKIRAPDPRLPRHSKLQLLQSWLADNHAFCTSREPDQ